MNNSKGKMEKQNGHVSRERGSGRGAAGSVVQAEGQGGGEQTRTDSMGQACSSGWVCPPQVGPGQGPCWATDSFQEPWYKPCLLPGGGWT